MTWSWSIMSKKILIVQRPARRILAIISWLASPKQPATARINLKSWFQVQSIITGFPNSQQMKQFRLQLRPPNLHLWLALYQEKGTSRQEQQSPDRYTRLPARLLLESPPISYPHYLSNSSMRIYYSLPHELWQIHNHPSWPRASTFIFPCWKKKLTKKKKRVPGMLFHGI